MSKRQEKRLRSGNDETENTRIGNGSWCECFHWNRLLILGRKRLSSSSPVMARLMSFLLFMTFVINGSFAIMDLLFSTCLLYVLISCDL